MKNKILSLIVALVLIQSYNRTIYRDECLGRNGYIYSDNFSWKWGYTHFEDGSILYGVSYFEYYNYDNNLLLSTEEKKKYTD